MPKSISGSGVAARDLAVAHVLGIDGTVRGGDGFALEPMPSRGEVAAGGSFRVECFNPRGVRRWVDDAKNMVTLPALDYLLTTGISAGTQKTAWYCGLVDNTGYQQFANSDTMPSHAGWIENLQYTPTGRVAWTPGNSANQTLTNTTAMVFSMTPPAGSPATIRGLFVCSDPNSNASSILLFSTAAFSAGTQLCNNGDTLKVTYSVMASSS